MTTTRNPPMVTVYEYEHVIIDLGRHLAFHPARPETPSRLKGQVHRFVRTLLEHPEWVVSYRELASAVRPASRDRRWSRVCDPKLEHADKHAMHALASRVRAVLGEPRGGPSIIENFEDEGYAIQRPLRSGPN